MPNVKRAFAGGQSIAEQITIVHALTSEQCQAAIYDDMEGRFCLETSVLAAVQERWRWLSSHEFYPDGWHIDEPVDASRGILIQESAVGRSYQPICAIVGLRQRQKAGYILHCCKLHPALVAMLTAVESHLSELVDDLGDYASERDHHTLAAMREVIAKTAFPVRAPAVAEPPQECDRPPEPTAYSLGCPLGATPCPPEAAV